MRKLSFITLVLTFCFAFGHYEIHSQQNSNNSNSQQSQTNQNVVITQPVKVSLEPNQEEIEAEKGYKARQEKRDESNAVWNKTGIVINSLLFVLVLIQALFSYRALKGIQRQADIMETQAETMKEQFEVMEAQTKAMEDGLEETRKIIEQNERAVKASEKQTTTSKAMLKHSKEALAISERAYVVVEKIDLIEPVAAEQAPNMEVTIYNGGKTPAFNLSLKFTLAWRDYRDSSPITNDDAATEFGIGVILASGKAIKFTAASELIIPSARFTRIIKGKEMMYLLIELSYSDFLNKKQTYRLKTVYKPSGAKFITTKEETQP